MESPYSAIGWRMLMGSQAVVKGRLGRPEAVCSSTALVWKTAVVMGVEKEVKKWAVEVGTNYRRGAGSGRNPQGLMIMG